MVITHENTINKYTITLSEVHVGPFVWKMLKLSREIGVDLKHYFQSFCIIEGLGGVFDVNYHSISKIIIIIFLPPFFQNNRLRTKVTVKKRPSMSVV